MKIQGFREGKKLSPANTAHQGKGKVWIQIGLVPSLTIRLSCCKSGAGGDWWEERVPVWRVAEPLQPELLPAWAVAVSLPVGLTHPITCPLSPDPGLNAEHCPACLTASD